MNQLLKLSAEELALSCVHIHTEYNDSEDSMGHEIECDIDSVYVESKHDRYSQPKKEYKQIRFG